MIPNDPQWSLWGHEKRPNYQASQAKRTFHVKMAEQTADDAMFDFYTSGGCQDSTYNIKQCRVGVSTSVN